MDYYTYGSEASTLTSGETAALGALGGALIIVLLILMVIGIALAVLAIIGQWKMFKKSNQPGWAALIPIYNTYCMCKLAGINPWWILIVCVGPAVLSFIPFVGSLAGSVISIYFAIILSVSVARSFGKQDVYAVGLIFLAPIFYFLLGMEKEKYLGAKPMHDIVFDDWFKQANNPTTNNGQNVPEANISEDNNQSRFCPGCGAKIEGDTKFCQSCGKEL